MQRNGELFFPTDGKSSDEALFRSDKPLFRSDHGSFRSDKPLFRSDHGSFRSDKPLFRSDCDFFRSDSYLYGTDCGRIRSDYIKIKKNVQETSTQTDFLDTPILNLIQK
jgi:hypothetical protein